MNQIDHASWVRVCRSIAPTFPGTENKREVEFDWLDWLLYLLDRDHLRIKAGAPELLEFYQSLTTSTGDGG